MAIQELSPRDIKRLTGNPASRPVTGHELAESYGRVSRDPSDKATVFTLPPIPGEKVPTTIAISDRETSMFRSPDGNIHVARWRGESPQAIMEIGSGRLAPRLKP